ncbi:hypothetical protein LENED_010798 [Lentinula edodes]|uniref:Uncharacterized protein n=1 Tax=Lentinula edodes TaxID=5353 RepID=A0A1Q3END5_LENED|nr:hypothetical protein LENED_010798 [Lentinula edodes]
MLLRRWYMQGLNDYLEQRSCHGRIIPMSSLQLSSVTSLLLGPGNSHTVSPSLRSGCGGFKAIEAGKQIKTDLQKLESLRYDSVPKGTRQGVSFSSVKTNS